MRSSAEAIATDFWVAAGAQQGFPRRLDEAVCWVLPLGIFRLPRLTVVGVRRWLSQQEITHAVDSAERPLRACLVASRGAGVVLLDGTDEEDEQRFSLAHEVAHFMLDYLWPRRRVLSKLGESVREVLDGRRPPTVAERVDAVLANAPLGWHSHLMVRREDGTIGCGRVFAAELTADLLAIELLAPRVEVQLRLRQTGRGAAAAEIERLLHDEFGFPGPVAAEYAARLAASFGSAQPTVREWLGIVEQ